ncbi:MAG: hypothetical protein Fur0032_08720 [Terrimicrobiaceae bacterium]
MSRKPPGPTPSGVKPHVCCEHIQPRYGDNYKQGYIGFTHRAGDPVAEGITYFTRWSRMSDIRVSHAFIVAGPNEAVEAIPSRGVVVTPLEKYFADRRTEVFFRKPRKLTSSLGHRIAEYAKEQVGTKYDHLLIAAHLLEGSFLRRWIQSAFRQSADDLLGRMLDRNERWICSELAAYCLDSQPEYADRGILARPHHAIDPQELFEDLEIFAAWKSPVRRRPPEDVNDPEESPSTDLAP